MKNAPSSLGSSNDPASSELAIHEDELRIRGRLGSASKQRRLRNNTPKLSHKPDLSKELPLTALTFSGTESLRVTGSTQETPRFPSSMTEARVSSRSRGAATSGHAAVPMVHSCAPFPPESCFEGRVARGWGLFFRRLGADLTAAFSLSRRSRSGTVSGFRISVPNNAGGVAFDTSNVERPLPSIQRCDVALLLAVAFLSPRVFLRDFAARLAPDRRWTKSEIARRQKKGGCFPRYGCCIIPLR